MQYKLICLLGASAAGKDSVYRILIKEYGYRGVISTTTRPIRSTETNGREYYFVTKEEFQKLKDTDQLIEYRTYNTIKDGQPDLWEYGITKSEIDLNKSNHVVVCDLKGLCDLINYFGKNNVISIFINASEKSRRLRAIVRDYNFEEAEWQRRQKDDLEKFKGVENIVDKVIYNYDLANCINEIVNFLGNNDKNFPHFNGEIN